MCGFDKLWKHGVRKHIFTHEYDNDKHEWVDKLETNSKLATQVWLDMVELQDYDTRPNQPLPLTPKKSHVKQQWLELQSQMIWIMNQQRVLWQGTLCWK